MIHSPGKFFDGFWNWDILDGCFGKTNIKPSDIDGVTERNGKFLFIETKTPGVEVPMGQRILLNNLVNLKNGFVFVIIIWGNTDNPEYAQTISTLGTSEIFECNIEKFRALVWKWFCYADK